MESCHTPSVVRDVGLRTSTRRRLTSRDGCGWAGCGEIGPRVAGGVVNWCGHFGNQCGSFFESLHVNLPHDPAAPLMGAQLTPKRQAAQKPASNIPSCQQCKDPHVHRQTCREPSAVVVSEVPTRPRGSPQPKTPGRDAEPEATCRGTPLIPSAHSRHTMGMGLPAGRKWSETEPCCWMPHSANLLKIEESLNTQGFRAI